MSFHHIAAMAEVRRTDVIIGIPVFLFIRMMVDMVRHIALIEAMIGHGLSFTRWNGLSFLWGERGKGVFE